MVMLLIFSIWSEVSDRVCPLSGTLFVLGTEILALAIKKNPKIEGIRVGEREIKTTQYADDTTVFLKNSESMSVLLDLLEKFERCSGLKINCTKSTGSIYAQSSLPGAILLLLLFAFSKAYRQCMGR